MSMRHSACRSIFGFFPISCTRHCCVSFVVFDMALFSIYIYIYIYIISRQVQRCVRAYRFRCRECHFRVTQQAARKITRLFRRAAIFASMIGLLQLRRRRYHAAICLQCWSRRNAAAAIVIKLRAAKRERAAQTLQTKWKWNVHLACVLHRRSMHRRHMRHQAAIVLQQAVRSKAARKRLWALQDAMAAHRRKEVLRKMWENASAVTLQQWWKRLRSYVRR